MRDEKQTEEDKVAALLEELDARAWANVLASGDGRRVVWSILTMCGIYSNTFTGRADAAFLEGRRSIGLELLRDRIHAQGPTLYPEMMMADAEEQERLRIATLVDAENDDPLD